MFYQQNKIEGNLGCTICHHKLTSPKLLPCGNAVCEQCIRPILQTGNQKLFKCPVCECTHDMPKNQKFPEIKCLENILKETPDTIVPSRISKQLSAKLDTNQETIMEFKSFVLNNGADELHEYCHQLRMEVQLAQECRISEINKQAEQVIKSIGSLENENTEKINGEINKSNALIGIMEQFHYKWRKNLIKFNKEETEIEEAIDDMKVINQNSKVAMGKLNELIKIYQKIRFNRNEEKISENFLGSLSFDLEDQYMKEPDQVSKSSEGYSSLRIEDWHEIWIEQIIETTNCHDIDLIRETLLSCNDDVEAAIFDILDKTDTDD